MEKTSRQFKTQIEQCRQIFEKKLHDYGASWRIMRASSITDQIFIKAKRIRTIETLGEKKVDEGIEPEFAGIVNYSIVALIQCRLGANDCVDITPAEALELYDKEAHANIELMESKNHDYGEAWRMMRVTSLTDLILTKIARIKQLEDIGGHALVSEGAESNYRDIFNSAVFALIKLTDDDD